MQRKQTSLFIHTKESKLAIIKDEARILTERPDFNYLWVGKPPEIKEQGIPGHDIEMPIQMLKQLVDNKMHFFCLKKYAEHYQQQFAEHSSDPTIVQPIEDFLEQFAKQTEDLFLQKYAKCILNEMSTLLAEGRGKVRDFVTIKVMLAYFLLAAKGGIVADTNIAPISKESFSFHGYNVFCAPKYIDKMSSFSNPMITTECWMMYAPANNKVAKKILKQYFDEYDTALTLFEKSNYSKEYVNALCDAVLKPLEMHTKTVADWVNDYAFDRIFRESGKPVLLEYLNIAKTYYNTHKRSHPLDVELIGFFQHDQVDALKKLIAGGVSADRLLIDRFSFIWCAIKNRAPDCVDYLVREWHVKITKDIINSVLLSVIKTEDLKALIFLLEQRYIDDYYDVAGKSLSDQLLQSVFIEGVRYLVNKKVVMNQKEIDASIYEFKANCDTPDVVKYKKAIELIFRYRYQQLSKLLKEGQDPNAKYGGLSLLEWAVKRRASYCASTLLKYGAVITMSKDELAKYHYELQQKNSRPVLKDLQPEEGELTPMKSDSDTEFDFDPQLKKSPPKKRKGFFEYEEQDKRPCSIVTLSTGSAKKSHALK